MPPTPIRELRDLTRYRASLAQEINRIANRIQKVLEDANIKLASVATDTLGASGRAMLEAIVNGEQDSQRLAEMAQGKLRNKIPELQEALQGRVSRHHRFLLRELLDHHYFVESKMQRIEQEVAERLGPFQSEVARLCTIPGVDRVTAWGLLAEIGLSMKQFPDALAARRGSKRATIAVAHKLLVIAYHILRDGTCYSDLGADYFDRLNPEGLRRRLTKRLEGLGFKVTLEPLAQVA